MNDTDFGALLARARAGDDQAVRDLLLSFEADVRLMVRVRLPKALRGQFDSMDFVQDVWQSVFGHLGESSDDFESSGHFRGYLAGVVRNKVLEEFRRRTRTQKYDVGREEPLYVYRNGRAQPRAVAAQDPTPSEQMQADDRFRQLVSGRPAIEFRMVELRRQGLTFLEIAAELKINERTVRRVLDGLRGRLDEESSR